jgi:hypothetical protein
MAFCRFFTILGPAGSLFLPGRKDPLPAAGQEGEQPRAISLPECMMTTQPPLSCSIIDPQQELSALSKLTASGLISIGFCLLAMLSLVSNPFQFSPAAFSLVAFGVGGLILLGKPWTPALGTLYAIFFLLASWYLADGLEEGEKTLHFHLHLLLSPSILVTFLAGIAATFRNYFPKP